MKKLSNLYFLVVLGFSLIPGVSPVFPFALISPPIFLIGTSMLKDLFDDLGRLNSDLKANGRRVKVTSREPHRRFTEIEKSNINPGDYIEVRRNEDIPCDLVVLFSSGENGSFFVETSNLDGETNLKRKHAVFEEDLCTIPKMENRVIRKLLRKKKDFVELIVEENTKDLDQFDGRMKITYNENKNEVETKEHVLNLENFVCGGCALKETEKIQGFAVFCGKNTKMYKNLRRKRSKWGRMDRKINFLLLILIVVQEILIFILIAVSYVLETSPSSSSFSILESALGEGSMLRNHWYLEPIFVQDDSLVGFWKFMKKYMTFFILFGYLIPMSVFVTFSVILSIQTKQFERRIKNMNARSSNLNPDLAGVDIIITDKTGTLTENKMVFAGCFTSKTFFSPQIQSRLDDQQQNGDRIIHQDELTEQSYFFLLCLAINNTITVRKKKCEEEEEDAGEDFRNEVKCEYGGESSDEVALVRDLLSKSPIRVIDRRKSHVTLEFDSEQEQEHVEFEILETFPFTSARKRMSIIVRDPRNEEIYLLMKGGDSELFKRAAEDQNIINNNSITNSSQSEEESEEESELEEGGESETDSSTTTFQEAVSHFSKNGYRVLVVGYKRVENGETMDTFLEKFRAVKMGVSEDRDEVLDQMMDLMEREICLTGVTAIEDRLQDGVPQVVQFFRSAGVKFIVMTGDQMETATQTSLSAGIFHRSCGDDESVQHRLFFEESEKKKNEKEKLAAEKLDEVIQNSRKRENWGKIQEMVVNQDVLAEIMKQKKVFKRLFMMIRKCRAVVFSRVTPLQKSDMTKKIQKRLFKRCLAIGDGANDVSMIQNANIGIGIMGREGSQAARASDFAIPNFHALLDLLAVEGRWSYFRCSSCLLVSLFKNFPITFIQILFLPWNGFSSQILIDSWILTLFNLIFLALPPAWIGTFDRDLSKEVLRKSPHLYENVRKDPYSGPCQILAMYIRSTLLSFVLFYFLFGVLSGKEGIDLVQMGFVVSTTSLILVFIQLMISIKTWDCFIIFINVLSMASYVLFCLAYTSLRSFWGIKNFYFIVFELLPLLEFYLWIGLIVGIWFVVPVVAFNWVCFKICPSKVQNEKKKGGGKKCYSCCCCCKREECVVCVKM